ncbi:MAG TPA: DUF3501 family protein [Nitrospiraceae bacterium]|nr:DUF3501 family protein [Nitrospiraceae bacterium]
MRSLTKEDVIPSDEYERVRDSFRQRIIELKRRRRISIGDTITLVFENRDTMKFQVQEMLRAEHIVDPVKVQEELDVYNALIPQDGELSATLFIEITDGDRIQKDLDALHGIDRGQVLALKAGRHTVYGEFEGGRSKEDKISAVHFVTFRPSSEWTHELTRGESPLSVAIEHPNYRQEANVPSELRMEWLSDLQRAGSAPRAGG